MLPTDKRLISFVCRFFLICITFTLIQFSRYLERQLRWLIPTSFARRLNASVPLRVTAKLGLQLLTFMSAVLGTNGLEPSTSRLSGVRSNHLSYAPL